MKYQFMPMFWGDFFANTLHLSTHDVGAYVLLIAHAWEHEGKIPYANAMRIARVNPWHWPKTWKQLEPFFEWNTDPTVSTPLYGTHSRVLQELHRAAELSNKRKEAALQKHSKSKANGHANEPHTTATTTFIDPSLGKGSKEPDRQTVPAEPKRVAEKQGMSPDHGDDYRSPPPTKSDHVLAPLPDKQPPRQPAQKQAGDKKPAENSRQELDAIYAERKPFNRPG